MTKIWKATTRKATIRTPDPFWWEEDNLDRVRARCTCRTGILGWAGPWRRDAHEVLADEKAHRCKRSDRWRETAN